MIVPSARCLIGSPFSLSNTYRSVGSRMDAQIQNRHIYTTSLTLIHHLLGVHYLFTVTHMASHYLLDFVPQFHSCSVLVTLLIRGMDIHTSDPKILPKYELRASPLPALIREHYSPEAFILGPTNGDIDNEYSIRLPRNMVKVWVVLPGRTRINDRQNIIDFSHLRTLPLNKTLNLILMKC